MNSIRSIVAVIAFCVARAALGQGAAPWADPNLPVKEALSLWFDAQRIAAARAHTGAAEPKDGELLDRWPDASSRQRDLLQPTREQQPRLVRVGDDWVVRFDGEGDHLRCVTSPGEASAVTLFVVGSPHENPGDFRGFFAANAPARRDYESGLTVDLGPGPSLRFETLNVEGRGFGGARDLYNGNARFGTLHVIEVKVDADRGEVRLIIDGQAQGARPFAASPLALDELTVGARYYTNGPGPQQSAVRSKATWSRSSSTSVSCRRKKRRRCELI